MNERLIIQRIVAPGPEQPVLLVYAPWREMAYLLWSDSGLGSRQVSRRDWDLLVSAPEPGRMAISREWAERHPSDLMVCDHDLSALLASAPAIPDGAYCLYRSPRDSQPLTIPDGKLPHAMASELCARDEDCDGAAHTWLAVEDEAGRDALIWHVNRRAGTVVPPQPLRLSAD